MPTPAKGLSSRAAQAEETRRQILTTAQRLFTEYGYDATSLQMIADEMGLTKAAVYHHFRAKGDILAAAMEPGVRRIEALLDTAAALRGRRARTESMVNGFVEFIIDNRHYAVMASTDPAAKRNRADSEYRELRIRALHLLYGDRPSAAERLSFSASFGITDSLPEFVDLTDDELRDTLRATMLRILRVPAPAASTREPRE